jgi:tRNA G18 (ribose-2'-O)-methylase SpoU
MVEVFLYAPQDFTNVCVIARTLEAFSVSSCYVFDPNRLIRARYGKSYTQRLRTVSAGAFFKIQWRTVPDPIEFLGQHDGRSLAVSSSPTVPCLFDFALRPDDLFIFGSERHGIPAEITAACSAEFTIPMSGETQSLNLAVAVGIVLAEHIRQTSHPIGRRRS